MWTIAAVNKKLNGPLGSYNGLTDIHLAHYFSNPVKRSQLKAAKLISRNGRIIPEQRFRTETLNYEKKKRIYDMIASNIMQNVVHKEGTLNQRICMYLDEISKMEKVENIKGTSRKKCGDDHSHDQHIIHSSRQLDYSTKYLREKDSERPQTQLHWSAPPMCRNLSKEQSFNSPCNTTNLKRHLSLKDVSPYISTIINNPYNQQEFNTQETNDSSHVKKRKWKKNCVLKSKLSHVSIPDSNFNINMCKVTMFYHGHSPMRLQQKTVQENILIKQQHCNGMPVVIYKGLVSANETFYFNTLNRETHGFSITVFIDGILYLKLSSCCVFRYLPGRKLGGSSGNFSITKIEGRKPCIKCGYRQIELLNKTKNEKLMDLNENISPEKNKQILSPREQFNEIYDPVVSDGFEEDYNHHEDPEEDILSSVKSEIDLYEEIEEENADEFSDSSNRNLVATVTLSDEPNESIDENLQDELNIDIEESGGSVAESIKITFQPKIIPFEYDSSSDEDGGKRHIVLASVHGSPTA